jgi:hypothetical protein
MSPTRQSQPDCRSRRRAAVRSSLRPRPLPRSSASVNYGSEVAGDRPDPVIRQDFSSAVMPGELRLSPSATGQRQQISA